MILICLVGTIIFLPSVILGIGYALLFGAIGSIINSKRLKSYCFNVLIGVDQLGNAIYFGDPDETISSRAGKGQLGAMSKPLCWILNKLDDNHCIDAIEPDEGKDQLT